MGDLLTLHFVVVLDSLLDSLARDDWCGALESFVNASVNHSRAIQPGVCSSLIYHTLPPSPRTIRRGENLPL